MKKTFFIENKAINLRAGMSIYLKTNAGYIMKIKIAKIEGGFIYSRSPKFKTTGGFSPVLNLNYFESEGKYFPAKTAVGEYHLPSESIIKEYQSQEARSHVLSFCTNLEYHSKENPDLIITLSKLITKTLNKNEKGVQEQSLHEGSH